MVRDVVERKTESMRKSGYQIFPYNWLVIYCNQTLPILDIEEASELCDIELSDYWSKTNFNSVFVEKGSKIVEFSKQGSRIFEINDLWK